VLHGAQPRRLPQRTDRHSYGIRDNGNQGQQGWPWFARIGVDRYTHSFTAAAPSRPGHHLYLTVYVVLASPSAGISSGKSIVAASRLTKSWFFSVMVQSLQR